MKVFLVCSVLYVSSQIAVVLRRKSLRSFLMNMRLSDGSFCMHEGGECDIRLIVFLATLYLVLHERMM